ncbi:MAG: type III-B CRISPR module-associated protein Cmr5 [Nitrospirota bacterium]
MAETISPEGGAKLKLKSIERGEKILPLMKSLYAQENIKHNESLKNFFKGLGPMVMQNGLGQTIAYLQAKAYDKKKAEYLEVLSIFGQLLFSDSNGHLTDKIIALPTQRYILMQKEAIEYAGWMKKFALAFYEEKRPVEKAGPEEGEPDADTASR